MWLVLPSWVVVGSSWGGVLVWGREGVYCICALSVVDVRSIVIALGSRNDGWIAKASGARDGEEMRVALLFPLSFFFEVKADSGPSLRRTYVVLTWDVIIDPSSEVGEPVGLVGVVMTLTSGRSSYNLDRVVKR